MTGEQRFDLAATALAAHGWALRHLRPLILAALTLIAYFAAIHRAQALPWALAALLSATLVIGIAWPRWLVRRLSVVRSGPRHAEEGETIHFQVEIENHGQLPRFMVELVDRLPAFGAAAGSADTGERTLGVVAYIPGGGKRRVDMPLVCEKRGFYRLGPVALASSFPLGLAEARRRHNAGVQELTVYPDIFAITSLPLRGAPSQIHRGGYLLPEGAGAAEFAGLREYRRGDNPRHVHWPTTARMNELMVKEFEPLASACLCIALDLAADANLGRGRQATFEYAVRIAGSIARHACGNNIRTRLLGRGAAVLDVPAASGDRQYRTILDALAVVAADGATPYAKVLEDVAQRCLPGETVVVFLAEPAARTPATLQALALLRARRAHLFAIVLERASFAAGADEQASGTAADADADACSAALVELGAHWVRVRRDDDLLRLFNP